MPDSMNPTISGELTKAPMVAQDSLHVPEPEGATAMPDEDEDEDLTNRLEALRS